jgi:galactokinase
MAADGATPERRIDDLVTAFRRTYGGPPEGIAEAPGRVNLIGEHVDYNDGLVLPFAIDRSVMCAWRRAERAGVAVRSTEQDGATTVASGGAAEEVRRRGDWTDYAAGVVWTLRSAGHLPEAPGAELLVSGNVPQGAGLSSSAALELAVGGALGDAFGVALDDRELALLCQRAEAEYAGVQCGIMDQFASALSRRDHALLVDCRSLEVQHVPLRLDAAGLAVVLADSATRRELATGAYNERRRECGEAVGALRERLARPGLASLRDVTAAEMGRVAADSAPLRRARHVVTEIGRVATAVDALRRDDFAALGPLMAASHASLRDDFDVSAPELDLLVELAQAQEYVLGARLTGAGFGGCTVNVVHADGAEAFERDVMEPYRRRSGRPGVSYVVGPADGLRSWRL